MKQVVVRFEEKVWLQQKYFVEKASGEISWLGIVEDRGMNSDDERVFDITEIFLLEQECSGARTEIDSGAIARLLGKLGPEKADKLLYWGHSHVNMAVQWSGTDEIQITNFKNDSSGFIISYVYNKKEEFNKRIDAIVEGFEFKVDNIKTQILKRTFTDVAQDQAQRISESMDFDINADDALAVLRTFFRKIPKDQQYIDSPLTKEERADLDDQMKQKVKKIQDVIPASKNPVTTANYREVYSGDISKAAWSGTYGEIGYLRSDDGGGRGDWFGLDPDPREDGDSEDRYLGSRQHRGAQPSKSVVPNKRHRKK